MNNKDFNPYGIIHRKDGLIDLLFPREGCPADCPCHDRLTIAPRPGLEEDIRRNYDKWRNMAREATDDRKRCVSALDKQLAKARAYEQEVPT